jgi:hypothetical protein
MAMERGRRMGRAIALAAVATGCGFVATALLAGEAAFAALMKGALAAVAVMTVGGAFQSLWHGDRVEEAEAAGLRVKFGSTRRALRELRERIDARFDAMSGRVYEIEKVVFGDDPEAGDTGPRKR